MILSVFLYSFYSCIKKNFEIPLLIPSPRGTLIYEYFLKSTLNAQGGDSYLNEFVYAQRWQIMLEVLVQ